jgi:hypothetical protein
MHLLVLELGVCPFEKSLFAFASLSWQKRQF